MTALPDLRSLLLDLVKIPSVSPTVRPGLHPRGERDVCEYLKAVFGRAGIGAELVDVLPGRPNLYARAELGREKTVILSVHTDVVPADDWSGDAFEPREESGTIYGRGSCDTKASVAAFAWAALKAVSSPVCKFNVVFAAVCDEEAGFKGSAAAAKHLAGDFAIAGEPTKMRVLNRHKGVIRFVVSAQGKSSHSSTPHLGKNAIYTLARAIQRLETGSSSWLAVTDPELGARTLAVTMVTGGQAANIIPDRASCDVDVRTLPGDSAESVRMEILEWLGNEVEVQSPHVAGPSLSTDPGHPLVERLLHVTGYPLTSAPYATDASQYSEAGIPAVVFGPGDSAVAHTANEQVRLADVQIGADMLVRFLCDD